MIPNTAESRCSPARGWLAGRLRALSLQRKIGVGGVWVLLLHVMLAMWADFYSAKYVVWGAFTVNMNSMSCSLLPRSRVLALQSRQRLRKRLSC